jgi:long-chain fatty acid transport protein
MKKLALIFTIFLIANTLFAGNVDTFGIGSKATALGGAYSAYANDPYASHYNPAGLTQIKSFTISVGAEYLDPTLKVYNYSATNSEGGIVSSNKDFSDDSDNLLVPHFGLALPLGKNFVFGLSAYVPWGLHVKWDDNPNNNPAAYVASESYYIRETIVPTLAYKINDKWSVGLAILLGKTYAGEKRRIYAPGLPNHNKLVKIEMEDEFNWSFNLGVQYKPIEEVTIGLTYRSKTDVDFNKGDADVENWNGINGSVDVDGVEIDHPDQIQAGVRYAPNEKISLELDVVWTQWSLINSYTAEFNPYLMGSTAEHTSVRNWKNTTQLRIGGEWNINERFSLRAGYFYDPSPIPDETFDTMWPDADRKTYSIGAGINITKNLTLDLVVQYSIAEYKREIGGESVNLNEGYSNPITGEEGHVSMEADGYLWGYGATLTYRF